MSKLTPIDLLGSSHRCTIIDYMPGWVVGLNVKSLLTSLWEWWRTVSEKTYLVTGRIQVCKQFIPNKRLHLKHKDNNFVSTAKHFLHKRRQFHHCANIFGAQLKKKFHPLQICAATFLCNKQQTMWNITRHNNFRLQPLLHPKKVKPIMAAVVDKAL